MTGEWALVTGPVIEPITIADAKAQARITHASEDGLILSYIKTARETGEQYMGRGFLTQTWRLTLDHFADTIWLPMAAPLQSVSSVSYYDTAGVQQTLATSFYTVDVTSRPGRILRAPSATWPSVQADRPSAVIVTYVVGWTTAVAVPEKIKHGIRMFVTALDADRDGLSEFARQYHEAAERCWSDRVTWVYPEVAQ